MMSGEKKLLSRSLFASLLSVSTLVVLRVVNHCDQVTKGVWGMSWRQKAMKGVEGCEMPGGVVKQALIPGFLNYCILNT